MEFEQTTWIYITLGCSFGFFLLGYLYGRAGNAKLELKRIAKSTNAIVKSIDAMTAMLSDKE